MTNYEKYKNEIAEILAKNSFALKDGQPVPCASIQCKECKYYEYCDCTLDTKTVLEFLNSEYVEQPKLTKREHMLCELLETGYIARDRNKEMFCYYKKPLKLQGVGHWSKGNGRYSNLKYLFKDIRFDFIKWEDKEPWSIKDLLKLEVEEPHEKEEK